MDGEQVTKDSSEPYGYNFIFTEEQKGEHEFKVTAEDDGGHTGEKSIKLKVGE